MLDEVLLFQKGPMQEQHVLLHSPSPNTSTYKEDHIVYKEVDFIYIIYEGFYLKFIISEILKI